MQNILWDMMRADILVEEIIKKDSGKSIKNETNILNGKIFLIHKISRPEFEESLSFYQKNPGLMKAIFDSINARQTREKYKPAVRKKRPVKIKTSV